MIGLLILASLGALIYAGVVFVVGWALGSGMIVFAVLFALVVDFAVGLALGTSPGEIWRDFP